MESNGTQTPPASRAIWVVIFVAAVVAVGSVGWGIYRGLTSSGDLYTRYREWSALIGRGETMPGWNMPYHPVTYLLLSPLFVLGFEAARIGCLLLNLAAIFLIWRRLCQLVELSGWQRWLLLTLFGGWANVRVTLGSGQLGLIWLAIVLGAFPWTARNAAAGLSLGLLKYTLVFPLYLHALIKRPRWLVTPGLVAVLPVGLLLLLSHVSPAMYLSGSQHATATMMLEWEGGTYLGTFFRQYNPSSVLLQGVIWGGWLALFAGLMRAVRDELVLLAALLLMSLWPVYHRPYDLVVAAPALALFIKHLPPGWSVALTLSLLGWYEHLERTSTNEVAFMQSPFGLYYPALLFLMLGVLVWVERERGGGGR